MDKDKKNKVLEILKYWKTIEFIGQSDIISESKDNKKLIEKIDKKENAKATKIEVFEELSNGIIDIENKLKKEGKRFADFPFVGKEIDFCIGHIERNSIVDYLGKYVSNPEAPEITYPKNSSIAWFSFKTDNEGLYVPNSFQLSPLLWAISEWERNVADKRQEFFLDTENYDSIVSQIEKELTEQNVSQFLIKLYTYIWNQYVYKYLPDVEKNSLGFCVYTRYVDEDARDKDDNPTDYADLGKSFFINDILLLSKEVEADNFGDKSDYEKMVVDYILSAYESNRVENSNKRVNISPKESPEAMRRFFESVLDVQKAPIGKWPSKYMPALMQQIAVNLAIDKEGHTPIFSVNGPPGTGKTTLLKEIIANNIVERAKLLAEYTEPDDAFESHSFTSGPEANSHAYYQYAPHYFSLKNDKINEYGMLVASCNNAAVENITIELPKGGDILDSLQAGASDSDDIRTGLEEVHELFELEKSKDIETIMTYGKRREEKDIYFTRYANKLMGTNDCWGLVSAPFGKRANIRKYCSSVLKPLVEEYKSNECREFHKQHYKKQKELFLSQLALVEKLKKELEELCVLGKIIPSDINDKDVIYELDKLDLEIKKLDGEISRVNKELIELVETYPKKRLFRRIDTSVRDESISEHKETLEHLKQEKAAIEVRRESLLKIGEYNKRLTRYSSGKKKMVPIDGEFINKYVSLDENISTKAQITNPWFTEEYNREREKLFLYACKFHKQFVISSKSMRQNIINLMIAWNMFDECDERMKKVDREAAMPVMLQTIFILTPVISTTFASAQSFLGEIGKSGVLGTLIVDESGQAQPQMAVGALFRCRKAIIVGDPKQIEPVVAAESDCIKQLFTSEVLSSYKDKRLSVQGFADYINPYGTYLGDAEEREWVGCPLVVHRRCIDPMYTISNVLSYDGTMKQQTAMPNEKKCETFILNHSCWIDVNGSEDSGNKNHFVRAQGNVVLQLLKEKLKNNNSDTLRLFIITPFTSVKNGIIDMIKKSELYRKEARIRTWLDTNNVGTVHTFQGQGTDEVIFLLGCDKNSVGAAKWVNKNIVNVAVTRAKYRIYIIGDKNVWSACKPVKVALEYMGSIVTAEELNQMMNPPKADYCHEYNEQEGNTTKDESVKRIKEVGKSNSDICPRCGKALKIREGKFGKFKGCTGYPNCKYTENITS
jgi:hypothetical protein